LNCEVCGTSDASCIAEVEGSEMRVCDECSSLGTLKSKEVVVDAEPQKPSEKKSSSWHSSSFDGSDKVLKKNYGEVVRKAREQSDLSMEELSHDISEKESVIRRVEHGELKPDEELCKKLKRKFEVELFEDLDIDPEKFNGKEGKDLTIGDVAKVK